MLYLKNRGKMKAHGIIPARFHSTRLKGKPLIDLAGKPMIQRVYERAKSASSLSSLVVATDDTRIFNTVREFGGEVILTSPNHQSGTDRIAEAVRTKGFQDSDIIVNIQGDEPTIEPNTIDAAVCIFEKDPSVNMGTLAFMVKNEEEIRSPDIVKVVMDKDGFALFFSRFPIPYFRGKDGSPLYYKHIGLYAYRKDFLLKFSELPKGRLEMAESLEQLRALENGYRIKVVVVEVDSVAVDTPEDVGKVIKILRER